MKPAITRLYSICCLLALLACSTTALHATSLADEDVVSAAELDDAFRIQRQEVAAAFRLRARVAAKA